MGDKTATAEAMIEAAGLSKFYGPFAAAREISFRVNRGELVAFLGPNGAGKSTTMKMLTGYLSPSEGSARIAGHDMFSDRIAGSKHLGYLPENGPLYPDMTPYALLNFFGDARGMEKVYKATRIEAVVEMCDLKTVLHKAISKLSKGFRQRVGMAQALLHEPDVFDFGRAYRWFGSESNTRGSKHDAQARRNQDDSAFHAHSSGGRGHGKSSHHDQ